MCAAGILADKADDCKNILRGKALPTKTALRRQGPSGVVPTARQGYNCTSPNGQRGTRVMSKMDETARPNDRFASRAQAVLGMDLRSLALFRMCLAGLVIADLIARSFDLQAHYSDGGVLPRAILLQWQSESYVSLHMISGLWQVQAGLFRGFACSP